MDALNKLDGMIAMVKKSQIAKRTKVDRMLKKQEKRIKLQMDELASISRFNANENSNDSEERAFNNVFGESTARYKEEPLERIAELSCCDLCPESFYSEIELKVHTRNCEIFRKSNFTKNIFQNHSNLLDWVINNSGKGLFNKYFNISSLKKNCRTIRCLDNVEQLSFKCVAPCQMAFSTVEALLLHNMTCIIYNSPPDYRHTCVCGFESLRYATQVLHEQFCTHIDSSYESPVDLRVNESKFTSYFMTPITECRPTLCNSCNCVEPRTIQCIGPCQKRICYNCANIGLCYNKYYQNKNIFYCVCCVNKYYN